MHTGIAPVLPKGGAFGAVWHQCGGEWAGEEKGFRSKAQCFVSLRLSLCRHLPLEYSNSIHVFLLLVLVPSATYHSLSTAPASPAPFCSSPLPQFTFLSIQSQGSWLLVICGFIPTNTQSGLEVSSTRVSEKIMQGNGNLKYHFKLVEVQTKMSPHVTHLNRIPVTMVQESKPPAPLQ